MPGKAALRFEFSRKFVREGFKVVSIISGIPLHALGQGPQSPICLLSPLLKLCPQVGFNQTAEAELPHTKQPRRQHGIENGARDEFVMFLQQTQVVVGAVHDELVARQGLEQRVQGETGQRINEPIPGTGADLNQTNLFRVGVQTVRLGIHSDPGGGTKCRQVRLQFLFRIDHAGSIGGTGQMAMGNRWVLEH